MLAFSPIILSSFLLSLQSREGERKGNIAFGSKTPQIWRGGAGVEDTLLAFPPSIQTGRYTEPRLILRPKCHQPIPQIQGLGSSAAAFPRQSVHARRSVAARR